MAEKNSLRRMPGTQERGRSRADQHLKQGSGR